MHSRDCLNIHINLFEAFGMLHESVDLGSPALRSLRGARLADSEILGFSC